MKTTYQRTPEYLISVASMFWSAELSQIEADQSVIPKLIETQDKFISLLFISETSLKQLFSVIESSLLPANLFLKHLVVLADFGGEMLKRINTDFPKLFPKKELRYTFAGRKQKYKFQELPLRGKLDNSKLHLDGKKLHKALPMNGLLQDVVAILLFGGFADNSYTANVLAQCTIGNYLGKKEQLETFVKQRYIHVSRITAGAKSNTLGHITQRYVLNYLEASLAPKGIEVSGDGILPNVTHTEDGQETNFDIVVSDGKSFAAVEVSFQVTTNSVIERKAGQAQARYEQIKRAGHKIAYVIDGAGNFERINAVRTLCNHSDCTVAFTQPELQVLSTFLLDYFSGKGV
ncbi:MAG: restriction endonuclease [Candidatus Kapaibacteriota bacterium]